MNKNLERTIRKAVKSILANTDLSAYRINKIVKAEVADPASWGPSSSWGGEGDSETCIRRYYENIHGMNVFINFTNRLHARYGICYEAHRL